MKHYNNDHDSRSAGWEHEFLFHERQDTSSSWHSYQIEKFPPEFKKNIFKSIDKRFLLILIGSFAINIALIQILIKVIPEEITSRTINYIQEQYAKLLMDDKTYTPPPSQPIGESDYKMDSQLISGLNQLMNDVTGDVLEALNSIAPENAPEGKTVPKETRLPTHEQFSAVRKSTMGKRLVSREELEKQVNAIGLLGMISSNAKAQDQEYIQDVLEYASENSSHLAQVLTKLNAIEVPRYMSSEYLKNLRRDGISYEYAGLKGGRASMDMETKQIIENVTPLTKIETAPMKKNIQYEEVPSVSREIQELKAGATVNKTRSAQDVMRVVQSHSRALQDCYKQELKYDPTINGKIVVRFTIDPDGNVVSVSLVSSTLNSPRMEECILNRIKRWRNFPPCDPASGEKTYRQSFSFGEKK